SGECDQSESLVGVHHGVRSSAADDEASAPELARIVQEHHVLGLFPWASRSGAHTVCQRISRQGDSNDTASGVRMLKNAVLASQGRTTVFRRPWGRPGVPSLAGQPHPLSASARQLWSFWLLKTRPS